MSNTEEDRIEFLEKLGLTVVQAKVYLANIDMGPATAKQISKVAKVAREDVYRVMPSLQTLGLTKKRITKPAIFEAIPPKEAANFLINRRKQQTEKICETLTGFLGVCKKKTKDNLSLEKSEETILISNPEASNRRLIQEFMSTERTMDGTINWETHKYGIVKLSGILNRIIKKGVKLRSVMDKPHEELSALPDFARQFFDNPSYTFRYTSAPPACRVAVFDDERGFIIPSSVPNVDKLPSSLWTNNPVIVNLIKAYFEHLWDSAEETPY